jgi:hypothetical protein
MSRDVITSTTVRRPVDAIAAAAAVAVFIFSHLILRESTFNEM